MLSIHEQLSKLDLTKTQKDFDATKLYSSALWDENNVYPIIETGYNFEPHMNDIFDNEFNKINFNQSGEDSAI